MLTGLVIVIGTRERPVGLVALTVGAGMVAASILAGICAGFAALIRTQVEHKLLTEQGFERIAKALEQGNFASGPAAAEQERSRALVDIHRALREGAWDDADALRRDFLATYPDDPAAARLLEEIAAAREAAAAEIRAQVEAARTANDPERVITLRDSLRPLVAREALDDLDRDLAKWFLLTIHRRLLARTVSSDLAALTARVVSSLDGTPEGASLRAALPILRRAAGLCARCAQPYVGIENACPNCLGTSTAGAPAVQAPLPEPAPEVESADDIEPMIRDEFADALVPDD